MTKGAYSARRSASVALCVFCLVATARAALLAQSAVTVLDYAAPPTTLAEMWDKTPVIVRGKILRAELPKVASGEPLVHRPFDLQVLEVFRDAQKSIRGRTTIRLIQYGGTAEDSTGQVVRTVDSMSRAFEVGDQLVLFLEERLRAGGYAVQWGDNSAIRLSGDDSELDVNVPHGLRKMPTFEGKATIKQSQLLVTLRKLAPGR